MIRIVEFTTDNPGWLNELLLGPGWWSWSAPRASGARPSSSGGGARRWTSAGPGPGSPTGAVRISHNTQMARISSQRHSVTGACAGALVAVLRFAAAFEDGVEDLFEVVGQLRVGELAVEAEGSVDGPYGDMAGDGELPLGAVPGEPRRGPAPGTFSAESLL